MSKANTLPPHAPTVLSHRQPVLYTSPNSVWAAAAHLALFVLPRPQNVDREANITGAVLSSRLT